jgi:hypothetical protein
VIGRRVAAGSAALVLAAGAVLAAGVSATTSSAVAAGGGAPGYCPTEAGVTVVVDFRALGGDIVVRCAPGPVGRGYTGLDALQDAGFTPEGVRRYGFAFICRIAGLPTADQELPISGNPHYHEACLDTPPPQAFWGYWYAPNGGSWTYSQTAAISRDVIPGGFEGWSFSLNHESGDLPRPGVAPKRPAAPPTTPPTTRHPPPPPSTQPPTSHPPTTAPSSTYPTSTQPPSTQQPSTAAVSPGPGSTSGLTPGGRRHRHGAATGSALPTAIPATTEATSGAAGQGGSGPRVTGELPQAADDADSSGRTTLVGVGLVGLLAIGAGIAGWRRRAGRG